MASLKKCIEEKCKDCTYDPLAGGTWREQVELCRVTKCALWPVRPMTVATINLQRKTRAANAEIDVDGILAGLPDEEEDEVADPVA
jgi:hypothetical protein